MYSLYRAWLSLGPGLPPPLDCHLPTLPPTSPASTPLNLTSNNQGSPDVCIQIGPSMTQFSAHRSVLSVHSGYFKAALLNHTTGAMSVPNVNVDEFSCLLTYMYTGYLDLNIRNIYNILLATHILHMPGALEICRSFLLQSQIMENTPRRSPPPLIHSTNIIKPIPSRKTTSTTLNTFTPNFNRGVVHSSEETPFKTVQNSQTVEYSEASTSKVTPLENVATHDASENKKPSTEANKMAASASTSRTAVKNKRDTSNDKVIIDIACCDGPVRFQRVMNKNYGLTQVQPSEESRPINRNAALNKIMNESIQQQQNGGNGDEENSNNNETFTCFYCNHTFKSQYCYQKHARRHLNPVTIDAKLPIKEQASVKREVKLLDMNVQYYPCKTCGSKFPSYYFVHKHRKMCHPEEMADNTNKNNEMLPASQSNVDLESSNSAIDVETVNENVDLPVASSQ